MRKTIIILMIFVFLVSCSMFKQIEKIDGTAWREVRSLQEYYVVYDADQEKYYVLYQIGNLVIKVKAERNKNRFSFTREKNGKSVNFIGHIYEGTYSGVQRDTTRFMSFGFLEILKLAKIALYELTGIKEGRLPNT